MGNVTAGSDSLRKIIHIDMDCFYAAIEMRDNPSLRGKPVAVGGDSARGVVCTANYEARKFGIHSAMPGFKARERCPHLISLAVDMPKYVEESGRIRAILASYTDLIEPLSLDEAYLDVSGEDRYAWTIAREIRDRIRTECGLTASAGVAPNKLLAKIASDWRKPDGQFAVTPDSSDAFIAALPARKLWGVGPKAAARLKALGVDTCADLQQFSLARLTELFGKFGTDLYQLARGIDDRPVQPHRQRKSLSNERTFREDLATEEACFQALSDLHRNLLEDLKKRSSDSLITKIFVKAKQSDFRVMTQELSTQETDFSGYCSLLERLRQRADHPFRLLGCGVRFDATVNSRLQLEFSFRS